MYFRFFFTILLFLSSGSITFAQIVFFEGTWNETLKKAQKENKLIFVDAYASWCGPCKMMTKNTFTNPEAAKFYNQNFICVKINVEKKEGQEFRKVHIVPAYPTLLFITADNKIAHRHTGYVEAKQFIELGKTALDTTKRFGALHQKYENGNYTPKIIFEYLKALDKAYLPKDDVLKNYFEKQLDSLLFSYWNWKIIYQHTQDINSKEFGFLYVNRQTYAKIYTTDSVEHKIYTTFLNTFKKIIYSRDFNEEYFRNLKKSIKENGYYKADMLNLNADLLLLKRNRDWENYVPTAEKLVNNYNFKDAKQLNEIALNIYENLPDKENQKKAEFFVKKSIEIDNNYYNNNTYASILDFMGKTDLAVKHQEKAVELAKKAGVPIEMYQKTLDDLKQ